MTPVDLSAARRVRAAGERGAARHDVGSQDHWEGKISRGCGSRRGRRTCVRFAAVAPQCCRVRATHLASFCQTATMLRAQSLSVRAPLRCVRSSSRGRDPLLFTPIATRNVNRHWNGPPDWSAPLELDRFMRRF